MANNSLLAGLDIYHGDETVDFPAARSAGIAYCFIKATQGLSISDPRYHVNCAAASAADILVGAYHFFDPDADPALQAQHFVNFAGPKAGYLTPALDVEVASATIGDNARACADEIKRLTGHCPILYSSDSFFRTYLAPHFPGFTLWIARYGAQPLTPCAFWQNSDTAHMPGTPHALDRDAFFGSPEDLQKYLLC